MEEGVDFETDFDSCQIASSSLNPTESYTVYVNMTDGIVEGFGWKTYETRNEEI